MKKKYLYVSSFFMLGAIVTFVFFVSYQIYDRGQQETTDEVDTVKELRVNSSMKYVVESYDDTTGVVTSEERTIPSELAGMTREELEQYIADYNQNLQEERTEDEPDSMEMISFSKEKIVVRETYAGEEEEKGFYLKITDGEVVIYHNDMQTAYEYTGIMEEVLPDKERKKLQKGFFVEDEKELYSLLENLSS